MVGRATLTTVPSSIAMLDPSTVAASTHRPRVLVRRMAPGAGDTAETTPPILSPRREYCPARAAAPRMPGASRHRLAAPPLRRAGPVGEHDPDRAAGERHRLARGRGERGAAVGGWAGPPRLEGLPVAQHRGGARAHGLRVRRHHRALFEEPGQADDH